MSRVDWSDVEAVRQYNREYREANKEKIKEYQREYYQRPEVKARRKEYYQRPEVKAKRREYLQRPEVRERYNKYGSNCIICGKGKESGQKKYCKECSKKPERLRGVWKQYHKVKKKKVLEEYAVKLGMSKKTAEAFVMNGKKLDAELEKRGVVKK